MDLAWNLNITRNSSNAFAFIKRGGCSSDVLCSKNIEREKLGKRDVLVLMSGSRDMARMEAYDTLRVVMETLDRVSHTPCLSGSSKEVRSCEMVIHKYGSQKYQYLLKAAK